MPQEFIEARESNTQLVGVEQNADGTDVRLEIPWQHRADSRFIILSAMEKLRKQFPYQPFVLSWGYPEHEHPSEMSTVNQALSGT